MRIVNIIAVIIFFLSAPSAFAQSGLQQFQRQTMLGGRLPVAMLVVGFDRDSADIEKLFDVVSAKADSAHANLDWRNPSGDIGRLNANAGQGPVTVSADTIAALETAERISKWSKGAFDIASAGEGTFRDVKINKGSSSATLKRTGMQIRFDQMIEGFVAEYITRLIYAAGMQNAMVKAGNVFRGLGVNTMGPWRVQIQDNEGTFAHHALNLTVSNTGVASVSASQFRAAKLIDPRSKNEIGASVRGVVVVMNDAAEADGISRAVFVLGPDAGIKLLSSVAKGLIIDGNGKFLRSPGF